jgi:hypothetical protein
MHKILNFTNITKSEKIIRKESRPHGPIFWPRPIGTVHAAARGHIDRLAWRLRPRDTQAQARVRVCAGGDARPRVGWEADAAAWHWLIEDGKQRSSSGDDFGCARTRWRKGGPRPRRSGGSSAWHWSSTVALGGGRQPEGRRNGAWGEAAGSAKQTAAWWARRRPGGKNGGDTALRTVLLGSAQRWLPTRRFEPGWSALGPTLRNWILILK